MTEPQPHADPTSVVTYTFVVDTMGAGDATFLRDPLAMDIAVATCLHTGGRLRLPLHPQPSAVLA